MNKRAFTQHSAASERSAASTWKPLLLQPAMWGGTGILLSLYAPALVETYLYSATNVSHGCFLACTAVMVPTSIFRGVARSAEAIMVPAVGKHVSDLVFGSGLGLNPAQMLDASLKAELQELLDSKSGFAAAVKGSGFTGLIVNSMAGIVMPTSTAMVEHLIQESGKQGKGVQGNISFVGTATNALILGQIASIREKVTIFGVGLTMLACGAVLFLDYSAGVVADKAEKAKERLEAKMKGVSDTVEGLSDGVSARIDEAQSTISEKTTALRGKVEQLKKVKLPSGDWWKWKKGDGAGARPEGED